MWGQMPGAQESPTRPLTARRESLCELQTRSQTAGKCRGQQITRRLERETRGRPHSTQATRDGIVEGPSHGPRTRETSRWAPRDHTQGPATAGMFRGDAGNWGEGSRRGPGRGGAGVGRHNQPGDLERRG